MNNLQETSPELREAEKKDRICNLNDLLRLTFTGGKVLVTQGIQSLPPEIQTAILRKVQTFNSFTEDNDPYGEHDFGSFEHEGQTVFWKIDTYDESFQFAAEEPWDRKRSKRVLTIMLSEEY